MGAMNMLNIDSLPVEILGSILDSATYVPWALSTDPDSDIYTLPEHPPPSRSHLISSIEESTMTSISILRVCKLWWDVGLDYRFRYVLLRVCGKTRTVPGDGRFDDGTTAFSFLSAETLVEGTLAYDFFASHAHMIKRLDIVYSAKSDTDPDDAEDTPAPFIEVYSEFLQPLVRRSSGLQVLATTDLPLDAAALYDQIFYDVLSVFTESDEDDLEPPLRAFDIHSERAISSDYPCPWVTLYELPQLHRFRLNYGLNPHYTSRASWRDYLNAPRIPPFRSTYLTTCIYLPIAAEVLAPSLAHLSIIDFDVPRLPEDSRFVARYGDSLRAMHVQYLRVTDADGGFLSRALSPFGHLQGVCLTFPTWNDFYHFLLGIRISTEEYSDSDVLPLSVRTLGIAIATAGGDASLTDYYKSTVTEIFEYLAEGLLISNIRVLRLVDISTTEDVRYLDRSVDASPGTVQQWTTKLEARGVRVEAFDGCPLIDKTDSVALPLVAS